MADAVERVDASLDDDEFDEEGEGGGFGAKKMMVIVAGLLILVGGAAALYFTGMIGNKGGQTEQVAAEDADYGEKPSADASFLEIPDMVVNLSSNDGQPRYLRLSVQLELKSEADKDAVSLVMPRVVDQFQTYLRELRVRDLRGSAGIYRLQMELLSRVNAAAYPIEVQDVLFQEILIQ